MPGSRRTMDPMKKIVVKAYGKVNLGLDVTGKRPDGYHLVKMVMQTVDVCDLVTVAVSEGAEDNIIRLTCDNAGVPLDESNLAFRAARLLCAEYNIKERIDIDIRKNIPMAAGMAGGSADAAAVIKAFHDLLLPQMSDEAMDRAALKLGADVPFCLRKGTYKAEGIGEKLTKLKDLPHCHMVIVKPGFGVSTPWAYKALDAKEENNGKSLEHPDIDKLVNAINNGDISAIAHSMGNVLETVVTEEYPEIRYIRERLMEHGAVKALMSGSGPTVFGIFIDEDKARRALSDLGGGEYDKFKIEF